MFACNFIAITAVCGTGAHADIALKPALQGTGVVDHVTQKLGPDLHIRMDIKDFAAVTLHPLGVRVRHDLHETARAGAAILRERIERGFRGRDGKEQQRIEIILAPGFNRRVNNLADTFFRHLVGAAHISDKVGLEVARRFR